MRDDNRPPRPQVTLHQGRARPASATLRSPTHIALKALAGSYQDLDDKVGELGATIGAILEEKCVGSRGTVQLMIRVGDNPEKLKQRVVVRDCCAGWQRVLCRRGSRHSTGSTGALAGQRTAQYTSLRQEGCR
ncbi:hypothetical protein [Atopobium sp. oral taxon 416]|uniref:hypothetical protein n=1 Tax=Atopobium sp. oral taxon 416 TaxID=712157 RepID=UPI001BA768DF|nr:hypothetical protein [Atopobium sp. oral taxon 416]QUC02338.1 hypothetical protein J4859_09795 [Atopobium sp. oral taxon 416]